MQVNDIVLVYNNYIGKVTKIENDVATIIFDYKRQRKCSISVDNINVIDDDFIDFILNYDYQVFDKRPTYKKNVFDDTIEKMEYKNHLFDVTFKSYQYTFVLIDSLKKYVKCNTDNSSKCIEIGTTLLYLREKFKYLKLIKENEKANIDDLISLTNEFIDKLFSLDLFHQLCDLITSKDLYSLYLYCKYIFSLNISENLKVYLILLVANNTIHLFSLCFAFDYEEELIFKNLVWALAEYDYSSNKNYMINRSIKLLRENKEFEWVKLMVNGYRLSELIYPNYLSCKIFTEIIKKTKNLVPYWTIDISSYQFFQAADYEELIFINASNENIRFLLDNGYIKNILQQHVIHMDFETGLKYYHLMIRPARKTFMQMYEEKILKHNPKIIVDMYLSSFEEPFSKEEKNIIRKYLPNDNQYFSTFIKNIFNENETRSLNHLLSNIRKGES